MKTSLNNLCIPQNLDMCFDHNRCSRYMMCRLLSVSCPQEPLQSPPCVHFQPHHFPSLSPHQSLYTRLNSAVTQISHYYIAGVLKAGPMWGSFLYLLHNAYHKWRVLGECAWEERWTEGRKMEEKDCTALINILLI